MPIVYQDVPVQFPPLPAPVEFEPTLVLAPSEGRACVSLSTRHLEVLSRRWLSPLTLRSPSR